METNVNNVDVSSRTPKAALSRPNTTNIILVFSPSHPVSVQTLHPNQSISQSTNQPSKHNQTCPVSSSLPDPTHSPLTPKLTPTLPDNNTQQKTANDVAGRENKGMGMADKLAGAVKDPVNQALGGNNQKSKGEAAEQNDTKGEKIPGSSVPGKNY